MKRWWIILLMGLLWQPLFSQESILKEYAEDNRARSFCFYPSTLRMINLADNEEYDQLVSGIQKLLIYTLDSAAVASRSYLSVVEAYAEAGFEEYAAVWGAMTFYVYGREGRENEIVGVFGEEDTAAAFYLTGDVEFSRLPQLIDTLEDNELLNFFNLNEQRLGRHE